MSFRLEVRPYPDPQVQSLVAAVQQEYVLRYGGPDEAAVSPAEFEPPAGLFLLGLLDDAPVATGGWRRIGAPNAATIELKRMFVLAPARGQGLARLVLAELEHTARAAGARRIVLNTGDMQPEAIGLYESSGYVRTTGYGYYACHGGALFYDKVL